MLIIAVTILLWALIAALTITELRRKPLPRNCPICNAPVQTEADRLCDDCRNDNMAW